MTKYLYCECPQEYWPEIKSIVANSYNDAVDRLIQRYGDQFDDDKIFEFDNIKHLQEYLNDTYTLAISDLEDIEEL